jgi:hypothetical protein
MVQQQNATGKWRVVRLAVWLTISQQSGTLRYEFRAVPRKGSRHLWTFLKLIIGWRDMLHTFADGWRLPVWTMLQTGGKLWVGLAPESHLHYQVGERLALA